MLKVFLFPVHGSRWRVLGDDLLRRYSCFHWRGRGVFRGVRSCDGPRLSRAVLGCDVGTTLIFSVCSDGSCVVDAIDGRYRFGGRVTVSVGDLCVGLSWRVGRWSLFRDSSGDVASFSYDVTKYDVLRGRDLGGAASRECSIVRCIEDQIVRCFGRADSSLYRSLYDLDDVCDFLRRVGSGGDSPSVSSVTWPDETVGSVAVLNYGVYPGLCRLLGARDPRVRAVRGCVFVQLSSFPYVELYRSRLYEMHFFCRRLFDVEGVSGFDSVFGVGSSSSWVAHASSLKRMASRKFSGTYPECVRRALCLGATSESFWVGLESHPNQFERYVGLSSVASACSSRGLDVTMVLTPEVVDGICSFLVSRDAVGGPVRARKLRSRLVQYSRGRTSAKVPGCFRVSRETRLCPYGGDSSVACGGCKNPGGGCG